MWWPGRPAYSADTVIKTGRIEFYDRPTGWGLIVGDDEELYVIPGRERRTPAPRVGERVSFEAHTASDGKRAAEVRIMGRGLAQFRRDAVPGGLRPLR